MDRDLNAQTNKSLATA